MENGLTILIYPTVSNAKVAVQLWYGVGSKDEKDNQRGLAHLLEHMLFKGTDTFSESDINLITQKLSGSCNAFTSYDYTGYIFDFPIQNWDIALFLLADCMRNCTFKPDLLNTELKAVIQELKMYKDDYHTSLGEALMASIFNEHPYHFPIIGYKQDLWHITQERLLSFYKQHYVPNNATLVIVGNVEPEQAKEYAYKAFGAIPAAPSYIKESYSYQNDLRSNAVTLLRDIQQPIIVYCWVIPGLQEKNFYLSELVGWVLGQGKGSRLYKKLVEQEGLASDIEIDYFELFNPSGFFIHVDPIDSNDIPLIQKIIIEEIGKIKNEGIDEVELARAKKQALMEYLSIFESNQKLAYELGKAFLSSGNEKSIFSYKETIETTSCDDINQFFKKYLHVSNMHTGKVLPLSDSEKNHWRDLQEESDTTDEIILSRIVRTCALEHGDFVNKIEPRKIPCFLYNSPSKHLLPNGLKLLWYSSIGKPKIDLILDLKVRSYYDPEDKEGLINFMCQAMFEGTNKYSQEEFTYLAESRGISIDMRNGVLIMSMLKEDFEFGLYLMAQLATGVAFKEKSVEKIRDLIKTDIASYWDNPTDFVEYLAQKAVYEGHPYGKNPLGTLKSINNISRDDLLEAYAKYVSPDGARLVIVGDLQELDIPKLVQAALSIWQNKPVQEICFPSLVAPNAKAINYKINRDQTILCYTSKSVARLDKNYEALLLLDQMLTGGILGSMSAYLFGLREQSGLFYTIGGSLVANCEGQPGIIFLRAIVSNDNLEQAQSMIENLLNSVSDIITDEDLVFARNAIINSFVDHFESNYSTAQTYLFLDKFNLPENYFNNRIEMFNLITVDDVKNLARELLQVQKLVKIIAGRIV